MFVPSASEAVLPSVADFIVMLLDESFRGPNLSGGQTEALRQFDSGLKPEFHLSTFTMYMNVHSDFLAGKEIEPKPSCFEYCRTQMNPLSGNSPQVFEAEALSSNSPIRSRHQRILTEWFA